MIDIKTLAEKLASEESIALFCHVRPDGDTIGSAVALKLALEKKGIKATVFCEDIIPERFFFQSGVSDIKKEFFGEYSAFVAIDSADVTRLGSFAEIFAKHKNTYCIDHHISNPRYAKYNYVVDNSSNAENIFDIITLLNVEICKNISNLLAMGIITDTGNFKHKNVTEKTFLTMARLVVAGADCNKIVNYMFTMQTKARAKLFGITMSSIRYFYNNRFAVATITKSNLQDTGAKEDETEGFIDFVMGIKGVEVGACVMEIEQNKYKVSLRSHNANVNNVASAFGGGGHILASGCRICGEYEEVIDKLSFAVSRELID